jgi:hypothetical protein
MGTFSTRWNRLGVLLAVAAALPAVSPVPYPGYASPEPYPAAYPTYQSYPAPEYQPSYPAPEYQPSYPAPAYAPSYPAPAYTPSYPAPSYPQPVQYTEYDSYEAVTYLELNSSIHCGVLPSTNDELYLENSLYQEQKYGYGQSYEKLQPVNPYAKSRWVVLITDDYYNYVCTGVIVNNYFVLTAASCINGPLDKYRVRLGDWDILNDYNEYEAYKNFEARICKKFPVKSESYSSSYSPPPSYGYQQEYSDLILLEVDNEFNYDKYPQVAPICLPTYPTYYAPPAYTPPYNPPAYTPPYTPPYSPAPYTPPYSPPAYPSSYPAQPYVAPSYTPSYPTPSYYQPPTYYSECWVVGWYAPPTTELKNHPKPTHAEEYQSNSYGGYGKSYQQPEPKYYEEYYKGYDQSRIQRKAKVKEIKCPSYGYGSQQGSSNSVCYVGVEGHDTCVADKGAGVYCVVDEKYSSYESGYTYAENYQAPYQPSAYPQAYPEQPSYGYEQPAYYKKEIKALIANELPKRKRAVLVAIVQKLSQCSENYPAPSYGGYGSSYQQPQSKPITATKVDYNAVDKIINIFWENAYDDSCPATKTYYQEPVYQPSYPAPAYQSYEPQYSPPAYQSYEPQYNPEPAYQSYPASYEPAYPAYEPQYQSYEPAYPSYPAPAYPAPAYSPPYEPAYPPPSYNPPPSYGYQG